VADDHDDGRGQARLTGGNCGQRRRHGLLIARRRGADQRRRRVRGAAVGDQLARDRLEPPGAHEDDERVHCGRQLRPIDAPVLAVTFVAGHDGER